MANRTLVCLLWIACFSTALAAREQTVPAIIAANAGENVRFSSGGSTAQIRVQILTPADQSIFDSGWKDGNVLDWSTANPAQSLADGSYRCTVMVKDLDGQLRQKDVALLVQGGRIAIDPASENGDPKIALFVHDEKNGAIVNTSGDLSFRFGKFFEGTDTEKMRLTSDGDLRVEGMIRTNNGIMFSDGTILRMSNGDFVVEKAATANPNGRRITRTVLLPQPTATPGRLTPVPNVSPDYQFKVDAAGVHIGTTPAFGLDVAGNVTLSSNLALPATTSASAGVITAGGVRFIHSFGLNDMFLGAGAGNFTTTGSYNTGSGPSTLQNITTGHDNTASGFDALGNNTTGSVNTASGAAALATNTTGTGNVAGGQAALASNTTGNYNTASGLNALSQNTSGSNNVGIGVNAGSSLTTGDNNIDIGSDSAIPAEAIPFASVTPALRRARSWQESME